MHRALFSTPGEFAYSPSAGFTTLHRRSWPILCDVELYPPPLGICRQKMSTSFHSWIGSISEHRLSTVRTGRGTTCNGRQRAQSLILASQTAMLLVTTRNLCVLSSTTISYRHSPHPQYNSMDFKYACGGWEDCVSKPLYYTTSLVCYKTPSKPSVSLVSIAVVLIGFFDNLAASPGSEPDTHSDLTGRKLIAARSSCALWSKTVYAITALGSASRWSSSTSQRRR